MSDSDSLELMANQTLVVNDSILHVLDRIQTSNEALLEIVSNHGDEDFNLWITIASAIAAIVLTLVSILIAFQGNKYIQKIRKMSANTMESVVDVGNSVNTINASVNKIDNSIFALNESIDEIRVQAKKLADINRPLKTTFPQMIDQIKSMCESALSKPDVSELYIMNRTSSFGKIHTYNPKFIADYKSDSLGASKYKTDKRVSALSEDDKAKAIFTFETEELARLIRRCGHDLPRNQFKLVVFDGRGEGSCLHRAFINDYFEKVNSEDDIAANRGLQFYKYGEMPNHNQGIINCTKLSKPEMEKRIATQVSQTHNQVIDSIKGDRESDEKWFEPSEKIPMQIYLLKQIVDGREVFESFIINAMNTSHSNNIERSIDGVVSREESLFSVFKTVFDDNFNTSSNEEK